MGASRSRAAGDVRTRFEFGRHRAPGSLPKEAVNERSIPLRHVVVRMSSPAPCVRWHCQAPFVVLAPPPSGPFMRTTCLAVLVALVVAAQPLSAQVRDIDDLTDAEIQRVTTLIRAADGAREDGRCGEAVAQYREALAVLDADPVRFSLASCLVEVGAVQEAMDELRLVTVHADEELVARAEAELARIMDAHPATLLLIVDPPDARVFVDEVQRDVIDGEAEVVVPPGSIDIRVEAAGYLPATASVTLRLDEVRPLRLRLRPDPSVPMLEPPPPANRGIRNTAIGLGAVSFTSFATAALLRVEYEATRTRYAQQLTRTPSTEGDTLDDLDDIDRTARTANRQLRASRAMTGIGVATGVGAVVTGILAIQRGGVEVAPMVDGTRTGVRVGVTW